VSDVTGPTGAVGSFSDAQTINPQTGTYTLAGSDAGVLVTVNSASAAQVVIPTVASASWPTGTHVDVVRLGTGAVSVTGAAGVTVNGTPSTDLRAQYSAATLVHYEADKWLVAGDLDL
jgi:hypothetical protein